MTLAADVGRTRLLLFEHLGASIPVPFLVVLVFWLCIIFASFGLFAPRNATVIAVLCVCALSVAGAIFLILELDRSFEGLLAGLRCSAARGAGPARPIDQKSSTASTALPQGQRPDLLDHCEQKGGRQPEQQHPVERLQSAHHLPVRLERHTLVAVCGHGVQ